MAGRSVNGAEVVAIEPFGDASLLARFRSSEDESLAVALQSAAQVLRNAELGVCEVVPAMDSIAIHFSDGLLAADLMIGRVEKLLADLPRHESGQTRLVELPVLYGGSSGPDLIEVAEQCNRSIEQVIQLHASAIYRVRMIGFTPGFPYLVGLPPELHLPRRSVPRLSVPAGSVAIANDQSGIYPLASPGGWHLIGRTPQRLFDPHADPPNALQLGDRVQFRPITPEQFSALESPP